MLCEVPPRQIRMHNHNVVKDEIKSWNYFQLDFVTESDPLRVLSLRVLAGVPTLPRGKGEFSMHPHHQLSSLSAMFNSSRLRFKTHTHTHTHQPGFKWMDGCMDGKRVIESYGIPFFFFFLPLVKFYSICNSPWKDLIKYLFQDPDLLTKCHLQAEKTKKKKELSVFITAWAE